MGPLLLYVGECGFCQSCVRLILSWEHKQTLRFATLSGEVGRRLRAQFPALGTDSLVWLDLYPTEPLREPRVYSDAALCAARYLGGPFRLLVCLRLIPRPWRDSLYRFVARLRHRLAVSPPSCALPPDSQRHRWLDQVN